MIYRILFIGLLMCLPGWSQAQEKELQVLAMDSARIETAADSTVRSVVQQADSLPYPNKIEMAFKPDPKKAVLLALVPGLGQIYNRKFWKLPIVYGGLMGCMYAITWNNKTYQDYSQAYFDIMNDSMDPSLDPDEWHESWQNFLGSTANPEDYINNNNFQDLLKRGKDRYRRYRDLSIIIMVGVYALSIIDAYVDAQLFDFDISPDLSMHWSPTVTPRTAYSERMYGVNWSLKF